MAELKNVNLDIDLGASFNHIYLTSNKEEAAKRIENGWQLIYTPENEMFKGTNLSNIWILGC